MWETDALCDEDRTKRKENVWWIVIIAQQLTICYDKLIGYITKHCKPLPWMLPPVFNLGILATPYRLIRTEKGTSNYQQKQYRKRYEHAIEWVRCDRRFFPRRCSSDMKSLCGIHRNNVSSSTSKGSWGYGWWAMLDPLRAVLWVGLLVGQMLTSAETGPSLCCLDSQHLTCGRP